MYNIKWSPLLHLLALQFMAFILKKNIGFDATSFF